MTIQNEVRGGGGGGVVTPTWEILFSQLTDVYGNLLGVAWNSIIHDFNMPAVYSGINVDLPTGTITLTGIANGTFGRFLLITNISPNNTLVISHENAGSLPQNRFRNPNNAASQNIRPNASVIFRYDDVIQRWKVFSR